MSELAAAAVANGKACYLMIMLQPQSQTLVQEQHEAQLKELPHGKGSSIQALPINYKKSHTH